MFTVEYSKEQKAFHVDDLKSTLDKNILWALNKNENDYKVIALTNTKKEADKIVIGFRNLVKKNEG